MRFALALLLSGCSLCAQDPRAIRDETLRLAAEPGLSSGRVGVLVADASTGEDLAALDADKAFLPASNMKLVSAAVALETLGPDFSFETRLEARGEIAGSVLQGDLLLVGGGDPTLGGGHPASALAAFLPMADALARLGVRTVRGRVLGVDDIQAEEHLGSGWQWDYLQEGYAAPFSGLNFADNVVHLQVAGSAPGAPPHCRFTPDAHYLQLLGGASCGPADSEWTFRLERAAAGTVVRSAGLVPAGARERDLAVAVDNPTRYAAKALETALGSAGIRHEGGVFDADEVPESVGPAIEVARIESEPLAAIVERTLLESRNLWAEQIWRQAAQRCLGRSDTASCAEHSLAVLGDLGVDSRGMALEDGSGLSRRDLLTPRQIVRVLLAVRRKDYAGIFRRGLPVAGVSGTLKSRLLEGPARGHVRAKSGTLSRVVCLSGYIDRPNGRPPLVFSVMLNHFHCSGAEARAALDAFVQRLAAEAGWPP